MHKRYTQVLRATLTVACITYALPSQSAPFTFQFTIPFWSYGDSNSKTLKVTVDNGSTEISGQTFSNAQILSLDLVHLFDVSASGVKVYTVGARDYFYTDHSGTPYLDMSLRDPVANHFTVFDGTWSLQLQATYQYRTGGIRIANSAVGPDSYYSYYPSGALIAGSVVGIVPEVPAIGLMSLGTCLLSIALRNRRLS